jgi:hypothetical protein
MDGENFLLLQEMDKKDSIFRRIGLGLFVPMASQVSRSGLFGLDIPEYISIPHATAGLISTKDECTTIVII